MAQEGRLYIGGEWVVPSGDAGIDVVSPHTEEVIARAPAAGPAEVDRAVAAARAAIDASDAGPAPMASPADPEVVDAPGPEAH